MFRVDRFRSEARSRSAHLDALIRKAAPSLKRYFHKGSAAGEPGMRFKMIGYGESFYRATTRENVEWPVVGVALQKNYISVYFAVTKRGAAVTTPYAGRLGELRMGRNNFSFERFDDLDSSTAAALFSEAAQIFAVDQENVSEAMRSCQSRTPTG
ncbi:MAG TPA: hypothetical protein VFE60_20340 [Roseiarcus sp.]|nr:hypothetical protein [Roseiarcus sp.]